MSEREITPEDQQLLNDMGCTMVAYADERLGLDVSLAMPGSSTIEWLKRSFGRDWQQALEFRWTVLQELLQKTLIDRSDLLVKTASIERVNPTAEQIIEDINSLSNHSGDIPKPIPFPMINSESLKPDGTKIGYLVFERSI